MTRPGSSDGLMRPLFPGTPAQEASPPGLVQGLEEQGTSSCFTHTHTPQIQFQREEGGSNRVSDIKLMATDCTCRPRGLCRARAQHCPPRAYPWLLHETPGLRGAAPVPFLSHPQLPHSA